MAHLRGVLALAKKVSRINSPIGGFSGDHHGPFRLIAEGLARETPRCLARPKALRSICNRLLQRPIDRFIAHAGLAKLMGLQRGTAFDNFQPSGFSVSAD
jgi:hypothetical protein